MSYSMLVLALSEGDRGGPLQTLHRKDTKGHYVFSSQWESETVDAQGGPTLDLEWPW